MPAKKTQNDRQKLVSKRKKDAGLVRVSASVWVLSKDAEISRALMLESVQELRDIAESKYQKYVTRSQK